MKAVIQRVSQASVAIGNKTISQINQGYLILLGVAEGDNEADAISLAQKISKLRIMADKDQKMNKSLIDANAQVLLISQFTLLGNTKKGNRPSFIQAAQPDKAKKLYSLVIDTIRSRGIEVKTGKFGAFMQVNLINDGPTTLILDTEAR